MRVLAYRRLLVLSLTVLATLLAVPVGAPFATPVQAKPIEREHYSGADSGDFNCDGLDMHFEVTFSGLFMLKEGRKGDPTPYYFDNYEYHVVYTTVPDNGRWFTRDGNGLYKDMHITNVSGTIYEFEAMDAGQPFVIRDQDGNVVLRDRGRLLVRFVVDTKGDSDLSNDEFIEGSFELLADNGSHPGFYIDFCQLAKDLLL